MATTEPLAKTLPSAPTQQNPPAPDAAAPAPTSPAKATPQRISDSFFKKMGLASKEEPKPTAPATTPPADPPAKPAAPAAAAAPKADDGFDPNAPTPPPRQAKLAADDVKTLVREVVDGVIKSTPQKAPVAEPVAELPRNIKNLLPTLEELEKTTEYKGIKAQTVEFYRKGGLEDQYKDQWQKQNPGKKFDKNAEEHESWYVENDPRIKIDEDDAMEARDRVVERRVKESLQGTIKESLSERDQREAKSKTEPLIQQDLNQVAMETLAGLSPEFAELVKTPEKLVSLDKDDPIAEHVLIQVMGKHQPVISAAREVLDGVVPYDPKNQAHVQLDSVGTELEDLILQMPEGKRSKAGKRFSTISDWSAMSQSDRAKHWHIGREDVVLFVKSRAKTEASELYTRLSGGKLARKTSPVASNGKAGSEPSASAGDGSPTVSSHAPAPVAAPAQSQAVTGARGGFLKSFGVS